MYEFKHKMVQNIKNPSSLTPEQRFLWQERVAICMIDGGVSQERAERIARQEIERIEHESKKCNL